MPTLIERTCKNCDATFSVRPSRVKHGRGATCSRACQYALIRRRVSLVCATCAEPFEVRQADYDYRVSKGEPPTYCSRACMHASPAWKENLGAALRESHVADAQRRAALARVHARQQTPDGKAAIRERTKRQMQDPEKRERWKAGVDRRTADPAWRSSPQFRRGQAHAKYRGNAAARRDQANRIRYARWRKAVLTRDNRTCLECGATGVQLHAHHVQAWATHPELRYVVDNGKTLCASCHGKIPKPLAT